MTEPTCQPFKPETWPADADGFEANLCTDCGTPVRYGSRHGHCLEPVAAPEVPEGVVPKPFPDIAERYLPVLDGIAAELAAMDAGRERASAHTIRSLCIELRAALRAAGA